MGWTEYIPTHFKKEQVDRKAEIEHELTSNWINIKRGTLIGSVYYCAVEYTKRYKMDNNGDRIPNGKDDYIIEDIPETERTVFGIVCLTSVRQEGFYKWFGYKLMDETEGPYYYDCPDSILKLLSPTENKIANEWRKACKKYTIKRKEFKNLPIGTVIKFNDKLATKMKPAYQFRTEWWATSGGYYPKKYIPMDYEIVSIPI